MKAHYETYRYTDELCLLHSQSIVECRLPGSEITSVLAVQATAVPTSAECADGEVRYGGKLLLSVLYEDENGKSITSRIYFAHPEKTLTKEEVMDVVNGIIAELEGKGIALKK